MPEDETTLVDVARAARDYVRAIDPDRWQDYTSEEVKRTYRGLVDALGRLERIAPDA